MTDHLLALSTSCFYAGELDTGRRACEQLLDRRLPPNIEHQVRANRTWYTQLLGDLCDVAYHPFDIEPAHEGWSLFNPTLLPYGDRLFAIVRSSNYKIVEGRYVIPEADGDLIRTQNILVELDHQLQATKARTIKDPDYEKTGYPVDGLEDCRLRHTADGIGVSATVRNVAPFDGRCRIATADLDVDNAELSNLRVMASLQCQEHEKNWMPAGGGWLYAANHNGHAVTVDPDVTCRGSYQLIQRAPAPQLSSGFRGGGQVVRWRGGWLGIVHEVAHMPTGQRVYEHRLVTWDDGWRLKACSPAFSFLETQTIEFAAGLAVVGERVLVTFGVKDATAHLAAIMEDDVARLLKPVAADAGRAAA